MLPSPTLIGLLEHQGSASFSESSRGTLHCIASIRPSAPAPTLSTLLCPALSPVSGRLISKPAPARPLDLQPPVGSAVGDLAQEETVPSSSPRFLPGPQLSSVRQPPPAAAALSRSQGRPSPIPSGCFTFPCWCPTTLPRCICHLFPAGAPLMHTLPLLSSPVGNREKRCLRPLPQNKAQFG